MSASKDAYVTNKVIDNSFTASDANTGKAGTIDLYKLYNESKLAGKSSVTELTRGLIKFDLSPLRKQMLTDLNINDSSFSCKLKLHDVYGGQTTPSNFKLIVFPLAQNFDEGTGRDIIRYSDLGATNFITASVSNGSNILWNLPGGMKSGSLGDSNIDVIVSGNLNDGSGIRSLCAEQFFSNGTEDLIVDVTSAVSGMLTDQIGDNGFLVAYSGSYENNQKTYFVKRFASKDVADSSLRPKLIVRYNDSILDSHQNFIFNKTGSIFLNNYQQGHLANLVGPSGDLTGHNCMKVTLTTGSLSLTYNASQFSYSSDAPFITGIYTASFAISEYEALLRQEIVNAASATFVETWHSNDSAYGFYTGSLVINANERTGFFNTPDRILATVTNLKAEYDNNEIVKIRVYAEDRDRPIKAKKLPYYSPSNIYNQMYYSVKDFDSGKTIIPFDSANNSTRMSTDSQGMFFNLYTESLPPGRSYTFEFLIKDAGFDQILTDVAAKFTVNKSSNF
jgi:hypothetical protein